mmetsp:Transcript_64635/g.208130  ORF Transcript_64635/g.208130 Transcript_64635/m.208130 type:complete len:217 (-) Transcript_64635:1922-2572(-)
MRQAVDVQADSATTACASPSAHATGISTRSAPRKRCCELLPEFSFVPRLGIALVTGLARVVRVLGQLNAVVDDGLQRVSQALHLLSRGHRVHKIHALCLLFQRCLRHAVEAECLQAVRPHGLRHCITRDGPFRREQFPSLAAARSRIRAFELLRRGQFFVVAEVEHCKGSTTFGGAPHFVEVNVTDGLRCRERFVVEAGASDARECAFEVLPLDAA